MNSHYILTKVEPYPSLKYIASTSLIIPSTKIEEIYDKSISICKNRKGILNANNWIILDSKKPTYIKINGFKDSADNPTVYRTWEILFSEKDNGTEVTLNLLDKGEFWKNNIIPYEYFLISRYLFKNLGLEITSEVKRIIYPLEYLEATAERVTIYLGVSIALIIGILGYGYYLDYILLRKHEFLRFILIAMLPVTIGIQHLTDLIEVRTLRNKLYLTH